MPDTLTRTSPDCLSQQQAAVLLASVFIVAVCGIVYELVIGTASSYLFGNSVVHFSVTIGLFMSAMGIGAWLSKRIDGDLLTWFVGIELGVGLVGGVSAALLYGVFAATAAYHVVMVGLILVVGSLIGMEIPVVTRLLGGWASLKDTLSNVLTFDYLGALIASLLFPLVLLPRLGLLNTAFATGLVNTAVVGVVLWTFRRQLRHRRVLMAVTGSLAVVLGAGLATSGPITAFFERTLYTDHIVYTEQSPYQRIVVTRWADDVRLFLDGNLQFSAADEYRYHEALVHPAMALSRSREAVLVLGGGDGLAVREVLKYPDVERVVLVDLDPAVTRLGQTFPPLRSLNADALHDPRVEVVHADAFSWLGASSERFGVILIDLPDPNTDSLGKLYTTTFYDLVRRRLGTGGVMTTQATSPYFAREAFWSIHATVQAVGLTPLPYHLYIPSFGDWGFVLASTHPPVADRFALDVPTRYLTPELFGAAQLFDTDTDAVPVQPNTLDAQPLLTYYNRGWTRWN